jgi:hypothetical protein
MSYDSSWLTQKRQQRMLYAYKVQQETAYRNQLTGPPILQNTYRGGMTYSSHFYDMKVGAVETTIQEELEYIANNTPVPAPAPGPGPEPPSESGVMVFDSAYGESGSYIQYVNDDDLTIGIQSFTIEWFQFFQSDSEFPRVFSIGTYPECSIGVSYEGGSFILWLNGGANFIGDEPPMDTMVHIAIVGTSGVGVKIYQDGIQIGEVSGSYNISNNIADALTIGNESSPSSVAAYNGKIQNFRWVTGSALYTEDFTPPAVPLDNIPGTELLLLSLSEAAVTNDSSDAMRVATNEGVTFSTTI